jgi:hypothetical protein
MVRYFDDDLQYPQRLVLKPYYLPYDDGSTHPSICFPRPVNLNHPTCDFFFSNAHTFLHSLLVRMPTGPSPALESAVPVPRHSCRFLENPLSHPSCTSSPSHSWKVLLLVLPCIKTPPRCVFVHCPKRLHLPIFNIHARRFPGAKCRTTLSKPRIPYSNWGHSVSPRLLFGTFIYS